MVGNGRGTVARRGAWDEDGDEDERGWFQVLVLVRVQDQLLVLVHVQDQDRVLDQVRVLVHVLAVGGLDMRMIARANSQNRSYGWLCRGSELAQWGGSQSWAGGRFWSIWLNYKATFSWPFESPRAIPRRGIWGRIKAWLKGGLT